MVQQLIEETRRSCQDYLPKLIQAASSISYDLQSGNEAGAMAVLPDVITGLQWLVEAVRGMQENGCDLDISLDLLAKHFQGLEQALQVKDYILLADFFEYEIIPTLEEWLKKVTIIEQ